MIQRTATPQKPNNLLIFHVLNRDRLALGQQKLIYPTFYILLKTQERTNRFGEDGGKTHGNALHEVVVMTNFDFTSELTSSASHLGHSQFFFFSYLELNFL
jgi:hypothetical protein